MDRAAPLAYNPDMNVFGVTPEKAEQLNARMAACGLREEDLEETFIRSGGPGGQKVNRSATCVRLLHRPTGLEVKMQRERSQALNRFFARRRLCELLEARAEGHASPEARERDKIARQKARRKRRTQKKLESGPAVPEESPTQDGAPENSLDGVPKP
jgi:protein subunit release factor B